VRHGKYGVEAACAGATATAAVEVYSHLLLALRLP
jgi:hypothetical protein